MALQYAAQAAEETDRREAGDYPGLILCEDRVYADRGSNESVPAEGGQALLRLEYEHLLTWLIRKRLEGCPVQLLAYAFHEALAEGITAVCRQIRIGTGLHTVALSGGCFCNRLLLELTVSKLETADFQVLTHRSVPANDGGIALGQAVYAMGQLNRKYESEQQENNNDGS